MQKENSEIKQPKKRISPIVVPTIEEETSKEDSTKNSQNKKSKEDKTTNKIATNIINILYSAKRKALAPSAMASEISFILSFPALLCPICVAFINANITAIIPATGAK